MEKIVTEMGIFNDFRGKNSYFLEIIMTELYIHIWISIFVKIVTLLSR